jgi:hypothetical protein
MVFNYAMEIAAVTSVVKCDEARSLTVASSFG